MDMTKTIRALALALIIGLTLLPAGVQISRLATGQSGGSIGENRVLADWPEWSEAENDIAKYTTNISSFFNDNFGGRSLAIRVRNKLFRMAGDGSASVVAGRTPGWYFLNDSTLWDSYSGRLRFSQADVDAWLASIERLQKSAQNQGAVFAAIIPPDKARIYPEHVPAQYGTPSDRRFVTALIEDSRQQTLTLLDAEKAILRAKKEAVVYSKTDTHWTGRGAYEAYAKVMEAYTRAGAQFPVLGPDALIRSERTAFSGDLAQLMGLKDQITESYFDVSAPSPARTFTVTSLEDPAVSQIGWQTQIYENDTPNGRTLVIIGDSFSNVMIPFFKHSFDRIVFMHHRMGDFDIEAAMAFEPDAVLFAPVERTAVTMRTFAKP